MNHLLHKKVVASSKKSSYGVGTFQLNQNKRRKNVSYNKHEDYIVEMERDLMRKHRLGYSGLHKFLILKEAQLQFGNPYLEKSYEHI